MDRINELVEKISKIEEMLNVININLAKHNEADKSRRENFDRLLIRCDENRTKIVDLEVQVARINTKLMIFGVMATIVVPIASALLMKFLFHGH